MSFVVIARDWACENFESDVFKRKITLLFFLKKQSSFLSFGKVNFLSFSSKKKGNKIYHSLILVAELWFSRGVSR